MKAQAQFFLSIGSPPPSSRIIADHEDAGVSPDNLGAFLQAIQSKGPNLELTVYSAHLIEQQLSSTRHDWPANNTSLWFAEWNTLQPTWPTAIWPILSLWQYTDRARVPSFSGTLDCNSFRGSSQNFITIAS
jgi:lysozyme